MKVKLLICAMLLAIAVVCTAGCISDPAGGPNVDPNDDPNTNPSVANTPVQTQVPSTSGGKIKVPSVEDMIANEPEDYMKAYYDNPNAGYYTVSEDLKNLKMEVLTIGNDIQVSVKYSIKNYNSDKFVSSSTTFSTFSRKVDSSPEIKKFAYEHGFVWVESGYVFMYDPAISSSISKGYWVKDGTHDYFKFAEYRLTAADFNKVFG